MPADLNRVTLVGRLTRDPELRHTQGGDPVCSIRLAVSSRLARRERQLGRPLQLLRRHGLRPPGRDRLHLPGKGPAHRRQRAPVLARVAGPGRLKAPERRGDRQRRLLPRQPRRGRRRGRRMEPRGLRGRPGPGRRPRRRSARRPATAGATRPATTRRCRSRHHRLVDMSASLRLVRTRNTHEGPRRPSAIVRGWVGAGRSGRQPPPVQASPQARAGDRRRPPERRASSQDIGKHPAAGGSQGSAMRVLVVIEQRREQLLGLRARRARLRRDRRDARGDAREDARGAAHALSRLAGGRRVVAGHAGERRDPRGLSGVDRGGLGLGSASKLLEDRPHVLCGDRPRVVRLDLGREKAVADDECHRPLVTLDLPGPLAHRVLLVVSSDRRHRRDRSTTQPPGAGGVLQVRRTIRARWARGFQRVA